MSKFIICDSYIIINSYFSEFSDSELRVDWIHSIQSDNGPWLVWWGRRLPKSDNKYFILYPTIRTRRAELTKREQTFNYKK